MPIATPYVDEKSSTMVAEMEQKLRRLPPGSGVIFISISARPEVGGCCNTFFVRLGLGKWLSRDAGDQLVGATLKEELNRGASIQTSVFLGISGAAGDQSPAGAGTPSA